MLISTRFAVGAVLYLVEILGCKVFRRHGQLLQNASARLVQTLAFCSCNRKTCTSGSYPRMLISTRFAAGTLLYLAEILGCKACFAGMASSYRTLVPCPYRALVSGLYRR